MLDEYIADSPYSGKLLWALKATEEEFQAHLSKRVYKSSTKYDEEAEEKAAAYSQRFSGLTRKEQKKYIFENLDIQPGNREAIEMAKIWDPAKDIGLRFLGTTGTGKTAISKCLINKWARQSFRCKLITSVDFLDYLKSAMNDSTTSVSREQEIFASYDILILDDLGSELTTEWGISQIFSLINARFENEKHTFITSNLSDKQLYDKYQSRIYDRLINMTAKILINMPSYRGKKI